MSQSAESPCCCAPSASPSKACCCPPGYVTGTIESQGGPVRRIGTVLRPRDRRGMAWCRLSNRFRMGYTVEPGLYAAGSPTAESPVLLSANYKYSFDLLRQSINGLDAWVLVLDTKGINVWCAAGKGTFGTAEIVKRVALCGLETIVTHRALIAPMLGAPGIKAHEVLESTGFRIVFGPVLASDIPAFVAGNMKATPAQRTIRFGLLDRAVLAPMELVPALNRFALLALGLLAVFGLYPRGVLFGNALTEGAVAVLLGLAAVVAGTVAVPILLPWIPGRWFSFKGWLAGMVVVACAHAISSAWFDDWRLAAAYYLFFPVLSSYLALNFTGCTTFTSKSGVKRELRLALPLYIGATATSALLLVAYKLHTWGLI